MTAPNGWLGLIAGEWTISDDASSCARRAVRAGRAFGLRTIAVSTDERCRARLAADGWSVRPVAGLAAAPVLLLTDGPDPVAWNPGPGRPAARYVVQAQDGEAVAIVEDVGTGAPGRDFDCPGGARGRTARRLRARTRAALAATGLTRGPVEVVLEAAGRDLTVTGLTPGRIDGCVAAVIELATGHDVILGAVRSAVRPAGPQPRGGAKRHACLRRADLSGAAARSDAAWVGRPGLVSVRPGPNGVVVTVADDRADASRAAQAAVAELSGSLPRLTVAPGGAR